MYYPETRKFLRSFNPQQAEVFVVTGTKGKTTIATILSHALHRSQQYSQVILLNNLGVFVNGKQIYTRRQSFQHFGRVTTVRPGRYLHHLLKRQAGDLSDVAIVMEASYSCGIYGLGTSFHTVGIFSNLFTDHIDHNNIKSQQDLALLKSFVYRELRNHGRYVLNLDDQHCLDSLDHPDIARKDLEIIGTTTKIQNKQRLKELYQQLDLFNIYYWQPQSQEIFDLQNNFCFNLEDFKYVGNFINNQENQGGCCSKTQSNYDFIASNLMQVAASLQAKLSSQNIITSLSSFSFPKKFGRLLVYQRQEQTVIVDFGHEPHSIKKIINWGKSLSLKSFDSKPHLVLRLDPTRSEAAIRDYANQMTSLDLTGITIYDKIDGQRASKFVDSSGRERGIGETAHLFHRELKSNMIDFNSKVVLNEKQALKQAVQTGHKLIVHIHYDLESVLDYLEQAGFKQAL